MTRKAQTSEEGAAPAVPTRRRWTTKLAHPTYVIQACPREECQFPEAEGGYCPECGNTFHPTDCQCREHLARAEEAEARKRKKGAKRG